ncbi:glycosyltransferase family 1 protein [Xylariaceae sp. FL0804]|nr:glycosyltransferase family 1 protein [Xylariaceae sp. FL0804]
MTSDSQSGPEQRRRPAVLMVAHGLSGHLAPMLRVAAALRARGWADVWFLGPRAHGARIARTGARFVPLGGGGSGSGSGAAAAANLDLDDREYYRNPPVEGYAALPWYERVMIDFRVQCLEPLPEQWRCVKAALAELHAQDPARGVLVVAEAFFLGVLPLLYGAPLTAPAPPPPKTLCVSVTAPAAIRSAALPPPGYPFPFDPSPAGRARNARLWDSSWARRAAPLTELLERQMAAAGATRPVGEVFLSGANYTAHSGGVLQLGVPGLEYPRDDWPRGFQFAGFVQQASSSSSTSESESESKEEEERPAFPWWGEVVANAARPPGHPARRRAVLVAQGTVETDPNDLIAPTLRAFAGRDDVLVVAVLGWRGARLRLPAVDDDDDAAPATLYYPQADHEDDDDGSADPDPDPPLLPSNAYVADYLAYDAALAHVDLWVHNGGWGAVGHGLARGVPMLVAGEGMDKTENARRVAWSGAGLDLGTATPRPEQVREAADRVLRDPGFARRAAELRRESEALDCFGTIHERLLALAGLSQVE